MADKLVVGYKEFVERVRATIEATDEHSCQEQDGVNTGAMAKALWNAGYRFDPAARRAWLIVELRSKITSPELQSALAELLELAGIDDA